MNAPMGVKSDVPEWEFPAPHVAPVTIVKINKWTYTIILLLYFTFYLSRTTIFVPKHLAVNNTRTHYPKTV